MSIGAMIRSKDSCNVFGPGDHVSIIGGNPSANAAVIATGRELDEASVLEIVQVHATGEQLWGSLKALKEKYSGVISDFRGLGLIGEVEFTSASAGQLAGAAMERGLLLAETRSDRQMKG